MFVVGNCAYQNGKYLTHEEAGISVVADIFVKHPISPWALDRFPKVVIIHEPHVRYHIGARLFNDIFPRFFLNNTMPAFAVFCTALIHQHSSEIWQGASGVGHGVPIGWACSSSPGSGKTEAALLAASISGLSQQMLAGDTTKAALLEKATLQSDSSVIVDDVVLKKPARLADYADICRMMYDRGTRTVSGKVRTPTASLIVTVRTPLAARGLLATKHG